MILIITNYKKIVDNNKDAELIIKIFLILLPIFTVLRGYIILTRLKDYFTFTYAIILLYLCNIDKKKYYTIIQIGTICICLLGYVKFIVSFDNGRMIPYSTYITKDTSIMVNK